MGKGKQQKIVENNMGIDFFFWIIGRSNWVKSNGGTTDLFQYFSVVSLSNCERFFWILYLEVKVNQLISINAGFIIPLGNGTS